MRRSASFVVLPALLALAVGGCAAVSWLVPDAGEVAETAVRWSLPAAAATAAVMAGFPVATVAGVVFVVTAALDMARPDAPDQPTEGAAGFVQAIANTIDSLTGLAWALLAAGVLLALFMPSPLQALLRRLRRRRKP